MLFLSMNRQCINSFFFYFKIWYRYVYINPINILLFFLSFLILIWSIYLLLYKIFLDIVMKDYWLNDKFFLILEKKNELVVQLLYKSWTKYDKIILSIKIPCFFNKRFHWFVKHKNMKITLLFKFIRSFFTLLLHRSF